MKYPFLDLGIVNAPYRERLVEASTRVINSGRYIGGPEVEDLERWLTQFTHTDYAVGVSNGLDALRLILEGYKAMGFLQEGDGVLVPANTYIASVLAVTASGLKPVFVDPDAETMNLSGSALRNHITPDVKAIMPVHLYGRLAWDEEMADIVSKNHLIVIEDGAQAIGAEGVGRLGGATALSFYPTKNLGALGDAGAVVTDNEELARTVRAIANYGSDRRYHNIYRGFNCRMDPMQAAMLMVQAPDLQSANERRRRRAQLYNQLITNPVIITPAEPNNPLAHVWHQYVVRVAQGGRDEFRRYLTEHGIGTDIHYPVPPHRQPCYGEYSESHLPIAEKFAASVLSLPISDCTSISDVKEISEIINQYRP